LTGWASDLIRVRSVASKALPLVKTVGLAVLSGALPLERDRLRLTQSEGVNHAIKQRLDHDRAPKIDATSSDHGLALDEASATSGAADASLNAGRL